MKKFFSLILCLIMILQVMAVGAFSASAAEPQALVSFEDSFDYDEFNNPFCTEHNIFSTFDNRLVGYNAAAPEIKDGAMKFEKGDGLMLYWENIPGISFDESKTYTLTFKTTVTDMGDNTGIADNASGGWTREMFFSFGGWYNQIEFRDNAGGYAHSCGIRAGSKGSDFSTNNWAADPSVYVKDKTYTCTVVWKPSEATVTSTVTDGEDFTLSGTRKSDRVYGGINEITEALVWRCEDGKMELDDVTFSDGTNTYTEDFSSAKTYMTESDIWELESKQRTDAKEPTFDGSDVLKLSQKNSVNFNWTKVPNVGEYSQSKIYTFGFDVTVTNEGGEAGDANQWGNSPDHTRALYVGFGGYYTFLSLPDKNGDIDIAYGAKKVDYSHTNDKLRVELIWKGQDIEIIVYEYVGSELNELGRGTRRSSGYVNMGTTDAGGVSDAPMTYLTLRCEDGAIEIDDFEFAVYERVIDTKTLDIPTGKQAIYECDVNYKANTSTDVTLGGATLFSVSSSGLTVGSRKIAGEHTTGNYHVKAYVNPAQSMVTVEVTTPDGGAIRRGFFNLLGGTEIVVSSDDATVLSNVTLEYTDVYVNVYTITQDEPVIEGDIYNVVTSFNDAATTRNFAWTTKGVFLGADMAVRYRVKETTEWSSTDAVKVTEQKRNMPNEDYYKCDITGLSASTTYEYQIGKKNGANDSDWSKVYEFKTAAESISDFSFLVVGDTQGHNWGGDDYEDSKTNKGAKYSRLAYDVAFSDLSNPAFMLHTGDVVEDGNNEVMWDLFFKALGERGTSTPLFATMGNHDSWIESDNFFFDYHFNHPNNGGIDGDYIDNNLRADATSLHHIADNIKETVYSFDYGDVHFISLNSGGMEPQDDIHIVKAQEAWLRADLEANQDARWTIIYQHQPVYHRRGGAEDRNWLNEIIEGYGVDLVIQGHSHLNTRTYPMINGGEIATKEYTDLIPEDTGTIYVTVGSAALNHDGVGNETLVEAMYNVIVPDYYQPTYTTVDVDDDRIVVKIKQVNGLVIDEFIIGEALSDDDDIGGGNEGGNTGNEGGNTGNEGGNTGNEGGNTENEGGNTGNEGGNTENEGGNTENEGGNTNNDNVTNDSNETEAPSQTETNEAQTDGETDGDTGESAGCGSSFGVSAALLVTTLGLGFAAIKKKED